MSSSDSKSLFVAFGNPLLDIVTNVTAKEESDMVAKFKLKKDVGQEVETAGIMLDIKDKK